QRKAALQKMPRKKKPKNPQPIVSQRDNSSDTDVDSDSSDPSDDNQFAAKYASVQRKGMGGGAPAKKGNYVQVTPSEPDTGADVLKQNIGFRTVGQSNTRQNGMGLDDFGGASRANQRSRSQGQGSNAQKLPPVNIYWPLEEDYQFRVACKSCFVKTGEGYKGYNLITNYSHRCDKDVLVIRRRDNQSLNWIKIRPFPNLFNSRFTEFKMCQQFINAYPCKIGEARCTFPHSSSEMKLWYMERDGEFSTTAFLEELRTHGIETSEQLAARQSTSPTKSEPQQIPGLNFKEPSRQRYASPAPVEQPPSRHAPMATNHPPPSFSQPPARSFMSGPPAGPTPTAVQSPPRMPPGFPPASPVKSASFTSSMPPPPQRPLLQNPLISPPHLNKPPPQMGQQPVNSQSNVGNAVLPLKDYDYKIVCPSCFPYEGFPGRYRYNPYTHECEENVLAVKRRNVNNSFWVRVRERTNHREFFGRYILCNSVVHGRKEDCRFGEGSCSFAHNEAEQALWALEKDGRFSITDFILQNRKVSSTRGFSLTELLKKYPGYFTFVCRDCFYGRPPRVSEGGPNNSCTGTATHRWDKTQVLAHVDTSGRLTLIDHRKFTSKSAFFRICKFFTSARISLLERDVWMLERDTDISRQQIVEQSRRRPQQAPPPQQQQQPPPQPGAPPRQAAAPSAQSQFAPAAPTAQSGKPGREKVPYTVQEYCGACWRNGGIKSLQDGNNNRCVKRHPNFELNKVFLILPIFKELRNLPHTIPRNLNFVLCRYIQEKRKCQYAGSVPCQFAHSDEERVLWIWMSRNNVNNIRDVVKACREDQQKVKINQGDSVVAVTASRPPATQVWMPSNFQNNTHYCRYCSIQCNSDRQWEEHCASEKHTFNVNSDKDHQWNYRQPPWGQGNNLDICSKHMDGQRCPYSHVPDMFNLCKYAHSPEELDEWRERYEWRQMKRTLAKEQNMFSYMDTLLDQYNSADSRVTVMSESLDGVSVSCSTPFEVFKQEKNAVMTWTFVIKTQRTLEKVALLHHSARLHFHLQCADGSKQQIASGEQFEDVDARGHPCYTVNVQFSGGMFGSFSQWVAFDFGTKPVLLRKLNVELGHETVHEKVRDLRQMLSFDRWTSENREVIQYQYTYDDLTLNMLQKYKEPASSETVVTQDSIRELNEHNYIHKMHRMLELEEITRHRLISSFNLVTEAEVMDQITEQKGTFFARNGELFMRLKLTENLTEDTSSGKLILTSVRSVLLSHNQGNKRRVYEAQIFRDENFNYDGRGKDFVYLCLAPVCVKELKLKAGQSVEVEVQFQMDRLHFVRMHYALDNMTSTDIVFPDVSKMNPFNEQHVLRIQSRVLNEDQIQAVRHIVAERTGYTPPFVMYGPFGTGKTETLAQAAMVLLREKPQSRILICAQSNSAADLYILKHLDPYLKKSQTNQPLLLRIVSKERRLTSVPADVKKFCCLSADGQSFEIPSEQIVKQHRIVVTTVEMSLQLTCMNLRGYFTHIFIDEAAQALECETIMPLILATDRTCVVLTGDHMQTSPRVYSPEARRQGFGMSLLERLYLYYEAYSHHMEKSGHSPLNIFLSINYRTKMEILRFISAVFYGGPEQLKAYGNIPSVVELTPLMFNAVQGKEVQDTDSTSFYNSAEATEVVDRVVELINSWPMEWGECRPEEIGIVTPYHDQVKQIRHILRSKRGRPELRSVKVETVQNMQGKEFRALFISTVRTWHLLESDHLARALEEADFVGGVADFAFLSDPKLLNTALTRTQSMVAVVGDPVALCAIGECIQIWRTYLKHCTNMNSVYPRHMNYDAIRNQVVYLQMSHLGARLKEVTDLVDNKNTLLRSSPKRDFPVTKLASGSKSSSSAQFTNHASDAGGDAGYYQPFTQQQDSVEGMQPSNGFDAHLPSKAPPQSKVKVTKVFSIEERDTDFPIEPDEVLLQLARESLGIDNLTQLLKVECVSVKIESGTAVLTYDEKLADESKRRKMVAAANAGKEFDSDSEIFSDVDEDTQGRQVYHNYTEGRLLEFLQEDADRYKLCTIRIKAESCHANVLDPLDPIQEVEVLGSLCRGLAFDGDEVVVEILRSEDEEADVHANGTLHGRVVGILQRAVDPRYQSFVCSADADNTALLTPVNPGIPRIFNVCLQKHAQRVKKGFVSVYELGSDKGLQFSHYEKVEANDPEAKLFIVRYLKWLPGFFNPLGVVVGVVPAGHDLTSALCIVDIEHHIPRKFPADVDRETEELYRLKSQLPPEVLATREDKRDLWCFTIESANSQDLQHAFSIDQVSDTAYEIGVHISDVAYYVEQGSTIDMEAMRRGAAILPIGREPVHMLPEKLSRELCSLQTGADRLALSVYMTVAASGEEWHVAQTSLRHTIINSKQHFTLTEVERILGDTKGAENDYLQSCVLVLFQIAHMHCKQRKGNAHLDDELSPLQMTPHAFRMVQELLVMANHQVADQLLKAFPQCTPLLHQAAPNPEKLEVWKSKHAADAINSVALTKPFLSGDKVCACRMVCMCVFSYMRDQEVKALEHFDVLTELWKHLVSAATTGHQDFVQRAVARPDNHPQTSVAMGDLQAICQPPQLICSGNADPLQRGHYSLNLHCMTNATSPLRNYISIVVLRLASAIVQGRSCPYSSAEMSRLVSACNRTQSRADSFATADTTVHLAAAMQARPLVLFPVVDGLSDDGLHLRFPTLPYIPEKERTVELSSLGPSTKPQVTAGGDQAKVTWQERIYDTAFASDFTQPSSARVNEVVELCADRFVSHIPPFHWQKLLSAVREENAEKLQSTVPAIQEHVHDSLADGRFAADVSSEVKRSGHIQHFADFSLSLHTCMVIQVQVAAELSRGVLSPRLQLLSLTPRLDICLEHQDKPDQCFAKVTTLPATSLSYSDETSYQERWMPVLALEAADSSVRSQESAIIHRVPILWSSDTSADGSSITGEFTLPLTFCKERQILMDTLHAEEDLAAFGLHRTPKLSTPQDLLCVRYAGLQIPDEPALDERVSSMVNTGCSVCWVGHCVVQGVRADKMGLVQVTLRLHSAAMKMPEMLLDRSIASQLPCTIEWIPRAQSYRHMEHSLACLKDASELAKDMATGRKPVNKIDQGDVPFLLEHKMSTRLNGQQKAAIETSLKQPFTVIQGGPGTGKTMMVAHLAVMFAERNRMTPQSSAIGTARTQVLICGPSDKSIDAVA
ncbi:hypothetical protein BaRGS_00035778, partial [Batillaria attramentaria]